MGRRGLRNKMVKCNRCPIIAECRKHGRVQLKEEKSGRLIAVCPILYFLDVAVSMDKTTKVVSQEIEKDKANLDVSMIQYDTGG